MVECWWTKCVLKLWLKCGNVHPMHASGWDLWYVKLEDVWMHHNHCPTTRYICCLVIVRWSLLTFDQLYVFLISWLLRLQYFWESIFRIPFYFLVSPTMNDFCILKIAPKQQEFIFPFPCSLDDSSHLTMASELPWTERLNNTQVIGPIYQRPKKASHMHYWVLVSFFLIFHPETLG